MTRRLFGGLMLASGANFAAQQAQSMPWADDSRIGRPFSKDPCVIRFRGKYLLYYSTPTRQQKDVLTDWVIGIAESTDLLRWRKVGEVQPEQECERMGICAPFAMVLDGKVHIFYQTYGNGRLDAICHADSNDGLRFRKEPTNPVFRPTGNWNAGRAIDAEVVRFGDRWLLYAATRDPEMKVQMLVGASAQAGKGFARGAWTMLAGAPLLKPELAWEKNCIEAPSVVVREGKLYMFYAGGYNNEPQQVGCARSTDGVRWERLFAEPFLPNGKPGEWNASESGHPGAFVDEGGKTWLFFQGNNDQGRTWYLSAVRVDWRDGLPVLARGGA
ncbi:MAG: family 43 glycosylhydrolase [Bryobacterales bacterium]|nr:family 43 glycosylhydrolase [Bryobacterales bacterium]